MVCSKWWIFFISIEKKRGPGPFLVWGSPGWFFFMNRFDSYKAWLKKKDDSKILIFRRVRSTFWREALQNLIIFLISLDFPPICKVNINGNQWNFKTWVPHVKKWQAFLRGLSLWRSQMSTNDVKSVPRNVHCSQFTVHLRVKHKKIRLRNRWHSWTQACEHCVFCHIMDFGVC